MRMHISAFPDQIIKGKLFRIEESVDEATRSISVLSICDNPDGMLKIGMFTTVHFIDQLVDYIHLPEKAILQGEKSSYVYVALAPNIYVRTPVEVEHTKEGVAVISKGLTPGSQIISEGGYYLK